MTRHLFVHVHYLLECNANVHCKVLRCFRDQNTLSSKLGELIWFEVEFKDYMLKGV
jgi:hypothetical protein